MNILGLNAYHGDVSAALVRDGQLVAAVEEERFRRIKHVAGFPDQAIAGLPDDGGIDGARRRRLRRVARSARPPVAQGLVPARAIARSGTVGDRARATWPACGRCRRRSRRRSALDESRVRPRMQYVEHHPAHLASAAFVSPVRRGGGLRDRRLRRLRQHVVGTRRRIADVTSTAACSFRTRSACCISRSRSTSAFPNYGDEFKVMGLAPYGEPRYVREIESLVQLRDDGGFELDLSYFRHWSDGVADDVGRRRAEARHACSRRSSRRCSGRRGGATSRSPPSTKPSPRRCRSRSRTRRCTCSGTSTTAHRQTRGCVSPAAAR